jgi:hypothetical protein
MRAGPCRVKSSITFYANARTGQSSQSAVQERFAGSGSPGDVMTWHPWLPAFFVILALAGCAQGIIGQAPAPNAPYFPENNRNTPERGGGNGGGGGSM